MSETWIWIVLLISAIATFLLRYSFLFLNDKITFSDNIAEWLKLIPPTAIVALIIPGLLSNPSVTVFQGLPKLIAAVIAAWVMWKTRNSTITLVMAMIVFWVLMYFI